MSVSVSGWANERLAGPVAVVVALAATLFANLSSEDGNGGTGPAIVCAAAVLIAGGVVYGLIVPRARRGARLSRAAMYMGIAAFVSVLAFWSGLPLVIAPAAIVLAASAPARDRDATIAYVLATIAIVLTVVGLVFG
jgi:hypothetical protein